MSEADARLKPSAQTAQATTTSPAMTGHGTAIDAVSSAKVNPTRAATAAAVAMATALCMVGCDAGNSTATSVTPSRPGAAHHALTIYGYNYTNRYIDSFSVNSQGGGNLDVSTLTSGGGGGTCCMGWTDGTPLPRTVHVQWVASACMQKVTNSEGETREVVAHTFKNQEVELNGPVPSDPGYFEVHFYPDQHIEVAITQQPSEPRLKLDKSRAAPEAVQYPPCKPKP